MAKYPPDFVENVFDQTNEEANQPVAMDVDSGALLTSDGSGKSLADVVAQLTVATNKIIAAPATEAKQDASNTTLAAIAGATLTLSHPVVTQGAAGSITLQAAVAGKIARLHGLVMILDANGTVQVQDSDGTALTGVIPLLANQGLDIDRGVIAANCLCQSAAGKGIQIVTTGGKAFGVATVSVET